MRLKFRPAERADFADSACRYTSSCTSRFIHLPPLPEALAPSPFLAAGGSSAAAGGSFGVGYLILPQSWSRLSYATTQSSSPLNATKTTNAAARGNLADGDNTFTSRGSMTATTWAAGVRPFGRGSVLTDDLTQGELLCAVRPA